MTLAIGTRVTTEYGAGIVAESSARRVFVQLDDGGSINVATGTPGYARIRREDPRTLTGCYCPSDCGCHSPYRLTVCGCTGIHGGDA